MSHALGLYIETGIPSEKETISKYYSFGVSLSTFMHFKYHFHGIESEQSNQDLCCSLPV